MKKYILILFFLLLTSPSNGQQIPALDAIDAVADGDLYYCVDVSDSTDSVNGTGKKCTTAQLKTAIDTDTTCDGGSCNVANTGTLDGYEASALLDNTDSQDLSLTGNTLSLTGDATTVDLSGYLDNTDTQDLSLVGNTLSLVGGGSVDLSAYLDDTDTNTTYTAGGTLLDLTGTTFSVDEGTLTSGRYCTYVSGTGLVCNATCEDITGGSGLCDGSDDGAGGTTSWTTETIQDQVIQPMVATPGNTETLIAVTYQTADNTIDFVVDNDLANYSWTNVDATDLKVGSVTQAYDATLTDIADGTITENLVNTANPWADNEVSDTLTVTGYMQDTDIDTISELNTWVTDATLATSGGAFHDGFSDFVANEHIDWTADQGATNINAGNYTDTNTTYTAGDGLTLTGTDFDFDGGASPGGELGGTWASPTIDDSVTVTGWVLGSSTATTPAENDNDTSIATTAYVQTEIAGLGSGSGTIDGSGSVGKVAIWSASTTLTYDDDLAFSVDTLTVDNTLNVDFIESTGGTTTISNTLLVDSDGPSGFTFETVDADPCSTLGSGALFLSNTTNYENAWCTCLNNNDYVFNTTQSCEYAP